MTSSKEGKRRIVREPYDLVRIILAGLLLFAAIAKCQQLGTSGVSGGGFLDSRWILVAAVEFELFLGLWLLCNLAPKIAHHASLLCFGGFAAFSLLKAISGAASCGCFGRVEVNPWHTFVIDISAILALLLWHPLDKTPSDFVDFSQALRQAWRIIVAWICLGVPAAIVIHTHEPAVLLDEGLVSGGSDGQVVLNPKQWLGRQLPILPFIEDVQERVLNEKPLQLRLINGNWIVLLYREDCAACRRRLPDYFELAARAATGSYGRQVALIELRQYGGPDARGVHAAFPGHTGRLTDDREWFVRTPVEMLLEKGTVVAVEIGGAGAQRRTQ